MLRSRVVEEGSAPPSGPEEPGPPPRRSWDDGDPLHASAPLAFVSEKICEALDLRFGQPVLDIGTGTGNGALAAARRGARPVGLDPAQGPLRIARSRAATEGLRVRWVQGRAEDLPFRDDSFVATISMFGAMFSDDPEVAAEEILRVTREGGTIGLASWTSEGLLGKIYAATAPPGSDEDGVSPTIWGSRDELSRWFGSSAGQMSTALRTVKLRGPSPERFVEYLSKTLGPVIEGLEARDPAERPALTAELVEICRTANRSGDETFLGAAQYLEVLVQVR